MRRLRGNGLRRLSWTLPKGYPIEIGALDGNIILFHAGTAIKDNELVTNGGRVLGVTAVGQDLQAAGESAYKNIHKINFKDKHFRKGYRYQIIMEQIYRIYAQKNTDLLQRYKTVAKRIKPAVRS